MSSDPRLAHQPVEPKTGDEPLTLDGRPLGPSLLDFWRWSGSDLLGNTQRGILAEYIVALAVGDDARVQTSWKPYDLDSADGVRVEVKSACEIQTWAQKRPSSLQFGIKAMKGWDGESGRYEAEAWRQADVYVFAHLRTPGHGVPDPLDVSAWDFYVVTTRVLDDVLGPDARTVALSRIQSMEPERVGFEGLREVVCAAAPGDEDE